MKDTSSTKPAFDGSAQRKPSAPSQSTKYQQVNVPEDPRQNTIGNGYVGPV